jgi:tetratricopeptide (TPR) repeat protein
LLRPLNSILMIAAAAALSSCGGSSDSSSSAPAAQHAPPAEAVSREAAAAALDAADRYIKGQELSSAEAILIPLIEKAPREVAARDLYAQVLMMQAMSLRQRGKSGEAGLKFAQSYQQHQAAIALQPTAARQQAAGMIALESQQLDNALTHFNEAARLDPQNPQHPLHAAQVLLLLRRIDEASAAAEAVLKIDAQEPLAHATLAAIALEKSEIEKAGQHIARARQIDPRSVGLRVQEAKILRRANEPARVLELLAALSDEERAQEAVTYEIAAAYGMLGDHMKAARAWEHRYRHGAMDPAQWKAAVEACKALLEAGETEQAQLWLQYAKLAAPSDPAVIALESRFAR